MKTCPNCGSLTFEDMDTCYDCYYCYASIMDDLPVLEGENLRMIRLKVALQDLYNYEALLRRHEGATLSIGCAPENAIVIPGTEVADCQCSVFYSQGQLWAEPSDKDRKTVLGDAPLTNPQAMAPGDCLQIGAAVITVMEV